MLVANMVWQIARRQLDFFEQIKWAHDNGFEAVSFHSCNCLNGGRGIAPDNISLNDLNRLKSVLSDFKSVDIHAPFENFDINLSSPNELIRKASVQCIKKSINFAAELNADTLTVHTGKMREYLSGNSAGAPLAESLFELEPELKKGDLMLGVEVDTPLGYELVRNVDLPHAGITLDTGHMCFDNGRGWREYGSIANVIREYHDKLVHMHFHDFNGGKDHLPLGQGEIDFREIIQALCEVGFEGSLCLELSPQYAEETDIIESKEILLNLISELKE